MKNLLIAPLILAIILPLSTVFAWFTHDDPTIKGIESTCSSYQSQLKSYLSTVLPLYLASDVTSKNQKAINNYTSSIKNISHNDIIDEISQYSYGIKKYPPIIQLLFWSYVNLKDMNTIETLSVTPEGLQSFILQNDGLLKFCSNFPSYKTKVLAEKEEWYIGIYNQEMKATIKDMTTLTRLQRSELIRLNNKKLAPALIKNMNLRVYKLTWFSKEMHERSKTAIQ